MKNVQLKGINGQEMRNYATAHEITAARTALQMNLTPGATLNISKRQEEKHAARVSELTNNTITIDIHGKSLTFEYRAEADNDTPQPSPAPAKPADGDGAPEDETPDTAAESDNDNTPSPAEDDTPATPAPETPAPNPIPADYTEQARAAAESAVARARRAHAAAAATRAAAALADADDDAATAATRATRATDAAARAAAEAYAATADAARAAAAAHAALAAAQREGTTNSMRRALAADDAARTAARAAAEARDARDAAAAEEGRAKAAAEAKSRPALPEGETEHPLLNKLLAYIRAGLNVYLYGPAGTGKTTLARQAAIALGKKFYCSGCVTMKHELEGMMDAHGVFHPSDLYTAISEESVYLFDEIDVTPADTKKAFNDLLGNGYHIFPGAGMTHKHPGCVLIAAANSTGGGRDAAYTASESPTDVSTTNRFVGLYVGYTREIDEAACKGNREIVELAAAVREAIKQADMPRYLCSPRNIGQIATILEMGRPAQEALQDGLTWSWDEDDLHTIQALTEGPAENSLIKAFKQL